MIQTDLNDIGNVLDTLNVLESYLLEYFDVGLTFDDHIIEDYTEYYWTVDYEYNVHFSEFRLEFSGGLVMADYRYKIHSLAGKHMMYEKEKFTLVSIGNDTSIYVIFDKSKYQHFGKLTGF
jgi:hypothetical protein